MKEAKRYVMRKMQPCQLKSVECNWHTPRALFDQLNEEFKFEVDVCADDDNHLCPEYWTIHTNGLMQRWGARACWMNPPYGGDILRWMQKALEESQKGSTVVCLVPARVDTEWWHELVMKAGAEVRFIRGRLKFSHDRGGKLHDAPFACAIVVYKANVTSAGRGLTNES